MILITKTFSETIGGSMTLIKDSFYTIEYKGHFISGYSVRTEKSGWEEIKVLFQHEKEIDHYIQYPVKSVLAAKQLITRLNKGAEKYKVI